MGITDEKYPSVLRLGLRQRSCSNSGIRDRHNRQCRRFLDFSIHSQQRNDLLSRVIVLLCCIYSFGAIFVFATEYGLKVVSLDDLLAMDEMDIWTSLGLESGPNGPIKQALMEMTTLAVDMHNQQQHGKISSTTSKTQRYKPEMRLFLEHFFDISIADLAAASNSRDPNVWHSVLMGKDTPHNGENFQIYEALSSASSNGKPPNARGLGSNLADEVLAISQHQLQQQLELDLPATAESATSLSQLPDHNYVPAMEYPRTILDATDMIRPASPEDTRVFSDEHWHQHERDVLFSIYNSLRGDSTTPIDKNFYDRKLEYYEWTVLSDEEMARHPWQQHYHCQWMGISCGTVRHINVDDTKGSDQKHVVTSIDMNHWNLRGTLPLELSELSFLKVLNLSNNHLTGTIPIEAFAQLNFLQHIFLNHNNLNGTLPMTGLPPRIREWNVAHNDFSGSLALPIAVPELELFDVSDNFLTGPIVVTTSGNTQSDSSLLTWPRLKFFLASDSVLTGLMPLFPTHQFPALRTIDFSGNLLTTTSGTGDSIRAAFPIVPATLWDFLAAENLLVGPLQYGDLLALQPDSDDQASQLQTLSVAHNQLTGPLPTTRWNQFQELGVLLLDHNRFTGTLPVGLVTGLSPSLVFLDISHNKVKGTIATEIGLMKSLHTINAMSNQITGNIPNEMTSMNPNLRLNFTDNFITGTIPALFCGHGVSSTNMLYREFGCDAVLCRPGTFHPHGHATLHSACRPCPSLSKEIDSYLSTTLGRISCEGVECVNGDVNGDGMLSSREILRLIYVDNLGRFWGSNFQSWADTRVPECELSGITCVNDQIARIDLSNAEMCSTGDGRPGPIQYCRGLPTEIGNLHSLEVLQLKSQQFLRGTIPSEIGKLTQLRLLDISSCTSMTGSLPTEIGKLTKLKRLILSHSRFEGTIPQELMSLPGLEKLHLTNNLFSGSLPKIGKMTNLKELMIARNRLSGAIPTEIGFMSRLENFEAYHNYFTGELPKELLLPNLKRIDLFSNRISSSIPSEFVEIQELQIIHLKGNHLTGTIPEGFGNLPSLTWFDVSQNFLSGTIPSTFVTSPDLVDFRVAGNMLYGEVPPGLCRNTILNSGSTRQHGCSGILCPHGTYSESGYAKDDKPCLPCADGQTSMYLGSFSCLTLSEADLLTMLYDVMDGTQWSLDQEENWGDFSVPVCDWSGIECDEDGRTTSISFPNMAASIDL